MGGSSASTQASERNLSNAQAAQAQTATAQSQQQYALTFPWEQQAGSFYSKIASGDPSAIAAETAPVAEANAAQTAATKNQIRTTMPRGGGQDLAIQEANIGQTAATGSAVNKAYTSAFPALASLSSSGLGLSVNEMANAISGLGQASSTLGTLGNQQAAGKATTLGFLGSLAGSGAEAAAAA